MIGASLIDLCRRLKRSDNAGPDGEYYYTPGASERPCRYVAPSGGPEQDEAGVNVVESATLLIDGAGEMNAQDQIVFDKYIYEITNIEPLRDAMTGVIAMKRLTIERRREYHEEEVEIS